MTSSETMLNISDDAQMVQVSSDVSTQYMLQQLTGDGRERDWAVVGWVTAGSFLENWRDPGLKPRRGCPETAETDGYTPERVQPLTLSVRSKVPYLVR